MILIGGNFVQPTLRHRRSTSGSDGHDGRYCGSIYFRHNCTVTIGNAVVSVQLDCDSHFPELRRVNWSFKKAFIVVLFDETFDLTSFGFGAILSYLRSGTDTRAPIFTIVKWLGKCRLPTLSEPFHNGKDRSTCIYLPSVQDGSGTVFWSASAVNLITEIHL